LVKIYKEVSWMPGKRSIVSIAAAAFIIITLAAGCLFYFKERGWNMPLFGSKPAPILKELPLERISVSGRHFVDEKGRIRIFHGVNLVNKDKLKGYIGDWDETDFEQIRRNGFNIIRLGIIWDGLEPEPGVYDDAYLDRIEDILDLCAKYGIYVLLDMHQDLYSVRFSDGAPKWATLTDNLPLPKRGQVWSDAYISSEAIQRAFDHFWANDPAEDGVGLQDHYAGCWKVLAERFGGRPEVIGYDFMNEPFPGSGAVEIFHDLLAAYAGAEAKITGNQPKSIEEVAGIFFDQQKKLAALQLLDDPEHYRDFINSAGTRSAEFDSSALAAFYSRMAEAVRSVSPHGILFLENSYFSNIGISSGIQPIELNGVRESQQGFAPHGYDFVVDTHLVGSGASENRVSVIFESTWMYKTGSTFR